MSGTAAVSDLVNLATALECVADVAGDHPAVVIGSRTISWRELDTLASGLAATLAEEGVRPGDRVAVALPNGPEFVICLLAITKIRGTAANINYRYRAEELAHVLGVTRSRVVIHPRSAASEMSAALLHVDHSVTRIETCDVGSGDECDVSGGTLGFDEACARRGYPRIERGDDEWLLLTGGTTGMPKPVVSRHSLLFPSSHGPGNACYQFGRSFGVDVPRSLDELGRFVAERVSRDDGIVVLPTPPLMHGTGLYSTLAGMMVGGTIVFPDSRSFDPALTLRAVQDELVTDLVIVGDVIGLPLAHELAAAERRGHPYDITSLRRVSSTGAVLSAATKEALLKHADVTITDAVAASEGGAFAVAISDRKTSAGTGRFKLAPGVRLLDADLRDVIPGSGTVGIIAAPVPVPTIHYEGDADASSATFPVVDGVRYAMPGDLARMESDGTLVLLGRGAGVINSGGEKVYPGEVEQVLQDHPGVVDVCVTGMKDEKYGEVVTAILAVESGHAMAGDDVAAAVRARLASYKVPKHVLFVPSIRRNPAGKIDREWLSEVLHGVAPIAQRQGED